MTRTEYDERSIRLPHTRLTLKDVYRISYTFPKSGKREDIIQYLLDSCFVENYIIKLSSISDFNIDDKIQDIWLLILEIPQSKWDELVNQGYAVIKAYLSGLIHRQIRSVTSTTYHTYDDYERRQTHQDERFWNKYDETNTAPRSKIPTSDEEERD